jgi:hypothetical protein
MTLRIAAVACIATLAGSPALAQRVCTLQLRPIGAMSNELVERAIRRRSRCRSEQAPAGELRDGCKTFSVNLGSSVPTQDALARSTPVLEGFEFQKIDNSIQLENSQTACSASYSFRPIKVWKVQVSASTLVLLDITEPSGQLHVRPQAFFRRASRRMDGKIEFRCNDCRGQGIRVPVTASVGFQPACNQTRPDISP